MSTLNLPMRVGAVLILGSASFAQDPLDERVPSIKSTVAKIGGLDSAGAETRSSWGDGLGRRYGASLRVTHRA